MVTQKCYISIYSNIIIINDLESIVGLGEDTDMSIKEMVQSLYNRIIDSEETFTISGKFKMFEMNSHNSNGIVFPVNFLDKAEVQIISGSVSDKVGLWNLNIIDGWLSDETFIESITDNKLHTVTDFSKYTAGFAIGTSGITSQTAIIISYSLTYRI